MILFFARGRDTSLLTSDVGSVETRRGDLVELLRDREGGVRDRFSSDICVDMGNYSEVSR